MNHNTIANLPIGTHKEMGQRGLQLKVTATSRTWQFYAWKDGRPAKKSLGKWPAMSLSAARTAAAKFMSVPVALPEKKLPTVGALADTYTKERKLEGARTEYVLQGVERYFPAMLNRRLDSITTEELRKRRDEIAGASGPAAARRAIVVLRVLFNFAKNNEGHHNLVNVAKAVKVAKAGERETFLTVEEAGIMRQCLDEMATNPRHFFLLAMLTGLRKSNILKMERSWIDLEAGTVTVPASHSKNKAEMTIPLSREAKDILHQRVLTKATWDGDQTWYWIVDLRRRMRERGVDKHFVIHDLRRTAGTRMMERGAPLPIISKFLGHKSLNSTRVYMRTDVATVRDYLAE